MGVVVAAMHLSLRQKVAIKFLLPGASKEVVQRFLREARSAARLKSDHVARVIDVSELETGAPYMVMEYLEGNDLSRVLRKRGAFPIVDAVDFVLQACEAIAEAHTAGIVHRDLKPANLFLTKAADGSATVKVLDFGISKDTGAEDGGEPESPLTQTAMLGSPNYMSPEQMRSTRDADARADIWSLGVILYQLLTGPVAVAGSPELTSATSVVATAPPSVTSAQASAAPTPSAAAPSASIESPPVVASAPPKKIDKPAQVAVAASTSPQPGSAPPPTSRPTAPATGGIVPISTMGIK
jgi:serine/threonine protein kinase